MPNAGLSQCHPCPNRLSNSVLSRLYFFCGCQHLFFMFFWNHHDRPARHTQVVDLQGGTLMQIEVIAVVQGS